MFFALTILTLLSGAAGLFYEVLWMKQLGYLFGNSAQASAATLSAFFLGLGTGSAWWGRRAAKMKNPLAGYAFLECGVFISALLYTFTLFIFRDLYPILFRFVEHFPIFGLIIKCTLAVLLISPAAFFMGGTFPLTAHILIKDKAYFGKTSSLIYSINTLGAAFGALSAGFYLPYLVGYQNTYLIALSITAFVALSAGILARKKLPEYSSTSLQEPSTILNDKPLLSNKSVFILSFISGFGTLSLEVLWTQMLAHVYQNTVYTFSAILVVTLICLALGAAIAHFLSRFKWQPIKVLMLILLASGLSIGLSSYHLISVTDNLKYISGTDGWGAYALSVFSMAFTVTGLPLTLLGITFPYLLKVYENQVTHTGNTLGNLYAINTIGSILGSLITGFILLKWLGLWYSILIFSILYLAIVFLFPISLKLFGPIWRGLALCLAILLLTLLRPADFIAMRVHPGENIVEHWNGPNGTLAVVSKGPFLKLVMNGHYGLGSSEGEAAEKDQAIIPLLLHPEAKSVFFLGIGTGIPAGEAASPKYGLNRIVACELSPDVITASKKHFASYTNHLFNNPKVQIVADDGRHYLYTTNEKFDIINSDLFVVYDKGAGDLYTREHFLSAAKHLNPSGIFVQWIPLYQLTEKEFNIIAKTAMDVFPQVTVWRNLFLPHMDAIAIVCQNNQEPLLSPSAIGLGPENRQLASTIERQGKLRPDPNTLLLYYCGNLSGAADILKDTPLNTEDRPLIEYMTPLSFSLQAANKTVWFAGPQFAKFTGKILSQAPPENDPALSRLSIADRRAAGAGYFLARSYLLKNAYAMKVSGANEAWLKVAADDYQKYLDLWLSNRP